MTSRCASVWHTFLNCCKAEIRTIESFIFIILFTWNVYTYEYMYIYMYTYIYIHIYVHMYKYIYIYIYIHVTFIFPLWKTISINFLASLCVTMFSFILLLTSSDNSFLFLFVFWYVFWSIIFFSSITSVAGKGSRSVLLLRGYWLLWEIKSSSYGADNPDKPDMPDNSSLNRRELLARTYIRRYG